ncbi:MAG: DUF4390 domain-containing protein [Deltaproteobacteria bacterium]|nr:DUF4390 domain-containing protein [Deltaproteobacteria bacterium]
MKNKTMKKTGSQNPGAGIQHKKSREISQNFLLPIVACWLLLSFFLITPAHASEVQAVNVKLLNNELFVSTSAAPDPKFIEGMNEGLSKEFIFYIDLFRVWKIWPDEFVTGKKITRALKSDPIKREYVATSLEGNTYIEKRFKDVESMAGWAMNIPEAKLTNVRELEPGTYFIKVTIEETLRKLPPVIGYIIFFVPEKTSIYKNSPPFQINTK